MVGVISKDYYRPVSSLTKVLLLTVMSSLSKTLMDVSFSTEVLKEVSFLAVMLASKHISVGPGIDNCLTS